MMDCGISRLSRMVAGIVISKKGKQGCKVQFLSTPACRKEERKDNRNVIFVRSDVDNLGDEE